MLIAISKSRSKSDYDSKPKQLQLRWDGDGATRYMPFYQYTDQFLMPMLSSVEMLLLITIPINCTRSIWLHLSTTYTVKLCTSLRVLLMLTFLRVSNCRHVLLLFSSLPLRAELGLMVGLIIMCLINVTTKHACIGISIERYIRISVIK